LSTQAPSAVTVPGGVAKRCLLPCPQGRRRPTPHGRHSSHFASPHGAPAREFPAASKTVLQRKSNDQPTSTAENNLPTRLYLILTTRYRHCTVYTIPSPKPSSVTRS